MELPNRDTIIIDWLESRSKLEALKIHEMDLRKQLVNYVFGGIEKIESRKTKMHLGNGYGFEAEQNLSYKIDEQNLDSVKDQLRIIDPELPSKLFACYYRLNEGAYKRLSAEAKAIVDTILTISLAAPNLTFIEPE